MARKLRPAQDQSPFGRIERCTPARVNSWLTIPRELIGAAYPIPAGPVPLEGLREYLLDPASTWEDRDRVWRWVVQHVRAEGGMWYAVAIYLAMPGLRARSWRMTPIPPHSTHDMNDTHAALTRAMMRKLHTVNLDRAVAARLLDQAAYDVNKEREEQAQVVPAKYDEIEKELFATDRLGKYPPAPASPDDALSRLVRRHEEDPPGRQFDTIDAELIGRTYLETGRNGGARPLVDVAPELELAESAARMRRERALTRMARHLDAQTRQGRRLTAEDAITPSRAENLERADLEYLVEYERRRQAS